MLIKIIAKYNDPEIGLRQGLNKIIYLNDKNQISVLTLAMLLQYS